MKAFLFYTTFLQTTHHLYSSEINTEKENENVIKL